MKTPEHLPPFEHYYDLNRLSDAGFEMTVDLGAEERQKLALWADVAAVSRFSGRISLRRLSPARFGYSAHLEADVTQTCTVTLEPVFSNISNDLTRTLHLVSQVKRAMDENELSLAAGDDEVPEEIDDSRYDLAAPLLEEFSLAIDPYPRAPGASFEPMPETDELPDTPFAVLKTLKSKG